MDNVLINITTTPNEVTANVTDSLIEVTINVSNLQGPAGPPGLDAASGLIKIVDLNGDFFTDLATANTYISTFTNATITNESFSDGVYCFTVPVGSDFSEADYFLGDNAANITAYLIDLNNLVSILGDYAFKNNSSDNFCSSVSFGIEAFASASGVNVLTDSAITFGDDAFNSFNGVVTFYGTIANSSGNYFGQGALGKFIILGKGSPLSCDDSVFMTGASSTILVDKYYFTNNVGGIDACLVNAIAEGCNVQFDGIDKENISNKALNFNYPNNDTYPTTQATISLVDNRIQSNIKIIGDWDATSGSYPLDDESNTTPFIVQWGSVIKAGWAFRVGYGQAGTVGGYEYENGDVVYALVDNATNSSADWGDLDHNLQQANESLRGTAKIVTDAIIANENSTDDERIVTTKKLWLNFLTRVLAIAHTFAAKITFTTAPRFSSVTASQYLKVDVNKDLSSVSGIPTADILPGNLDLTTYELAASTFKVNPSADAVASASQTIDLSLSDHFTFTLSLNTAFTFSNAEDGKSWTIAVTQAASIGAYTASFSGGTIKWQNAVTPVMTPTIAKTDLFSFVQMNGIIYGSYIQNF